MSALITSAIPKSGFETVRDLIGAILLVELTNQKTIQEFSEPINIYTERLVGGDSSEIVYINISLASAKYGEMTQQDSQGKTIYFIDIYTSGSEMPAQGSTAAVPGDYISSARLQKFMAMCAYIFRSPYYRTMGLGPGLIGGTYIEEFAILERDHKQDTDYTTFGRILLAVRIQERTENWQGVTLEINNTTVNLANTEKGYKFVFNN